jgi:hypothetical protein
VLKRHVEPVNLTQQDQDKLKLYLQLFLYNYIKGTIEKQSQLSNADIEALKSNKPISISQLKNLQLINTEVEALQGYHEAINILKLKPMEASKEINPKTGIPKTFSLNALSIMTPWASSYMSSYGTSFNQDGFNRMFQDLLDYFNGDHFKVVVRALLTNVFLPEELSYIELDENTSLKKASVEELTFHSKIWKDQVWLSRPYVNNKVWLEFRRKVSREEINPRFIFEKAPQEIGNMLDALRFIFNNFVGCERYLVQPTQWTITPLGSFGILRRIAYKHSQFEFDEEHCAIFKLIFDIIDKPTEDWHYRTIKALQRFSSSFERPNVEDSIIDLSIGFESILLYDSQDELNFKLRNRASHLIEETDNEKRKIISEHMRVLYDARSAIVHGSEWLKNLTLEEIEQQSRIDLRDAINKCIELKENDLAKFLDDRLLA